MCSLFFIFPWTSECDDCSYELLSLPFFRFSISFECSALHASFEMVVNRQPHATASLCFFAYSFVLMMAMYYRVFCRQFRSLTEGESPTIIVAQFATCKRDKRKNRTRKKRFHRQLVARIVFRSQIMAMLSRHNITYNIFFG